MDDEINEFNDCGEANEYAYSYKDNGNQDNLRAQLEQKENDLVLAAELGKALLEKKEELEKKIEQTIEEYEQIVEGLEQERHALHLKLENSESEYESTARELQYDISQLKEELGRTRHEAQIEEKTKLNRIQDLTLQNEKLQEELQHARHKEHEYKTELTEFRNSAISNQELKQTLKIEQLNDQVAYWSELCNEQQTTVEKLTDEKESLINSLEQIQDRVKVLELQKRDYDNEIQQKDQEIRELHEKNSQLNVNLEYLTEKASNSSGHSMTLFNELSHFSGSNDLGMALDSPISQYPSIMFGNGEIECDDDEDADDEDDYEMTSPVQCVITMHAECPRGESKVGREIMDAYMHLRELCTEIRKHMWTNGTETDESNFSDDTGSLNDVVLELKNTIHNVIEQAEQTQSTHITEIHSLQKRVGNLEQDLELCKANLHKLQYQLQQREYMLEEKTYKVNSLTKQASSQNEDIKILSSQRDKLQDMLTSDAGKPQMFSALALLKHARRERDAAVEKRFTLEKEVQQSRYEIIVLNHQLLEAIHQKNKVSQLLDQWQTDMANVLQVKIDTRVGQQSANIDENKKTSEDKSNTFSGSQS